MPRRVLPCLTCDQCALQSLHHLENLMSLSVGFDEPVKLRNTFRRLRLMPPRHAQPSPLVMRAWLCCDGWARVAPRADLPDNIRPKSRVAI
jgi:hypothetical protein